MKGYAIINFHNYYIGRRFAEIEMKVLLSKVCTMNSSYIFLTELNRYSGV